MTVYGLVKRDTEETHKEGLLLRFLPLVIHNYVNLLYTWFLLRLYLDKYIEIHPDEKLVGGTVLLGISL